jgi:hypothetical protein
VNNRWLTHFFGVLAVSIALASATDHAASWNDGSRLATVESLVDRKTWVIDESVFVKSNTPYKSHSTHFDSGTQDKLFIKGHFYSDKSPVPALVLAVPYQIWRWSGGASAAEQPNTFCWFLSFIGAGGPFVLSVLGIDRLSRITGPSSAFRIIIVGSFMLGTIALPYSRSVNNHILLLAATTWLLVALEQKSDSWLAGTMAGIAYTIDLGAGPVILLVTFLATCVSSRSFSDSLRFLVAATPWLLLHHVLNFMIGGTISPANANPEFFNWPGCPFNTTNLTGGWAHRSPFSFAIYALDLMIGKKGFLTHQPQLFFAVAAVFVLCRLRIIRHDMLLTTIGCFIGVWLLYAATSHNQSGVCVSVRWFVPLIAPAYYWLIHGLRARPDSWIEVAVLALGGVFVNAVDWINGPWQGRVGLFFWIVVAISGCSWGWTTFRRLNKRLDLPENAGRIAA